MYWGSGTAVGKIMSRAGREIFIPKQVYLWGRVKSMDSTANE